jgi:hypothetical protein
LGWELGLRVGFWVGVDVGVDVDIDVGDGDEVGVGVGVCVCVCVVGFGVGVGRLTIAKPSRVRVNSGPEEKMRRRMDDNTSDLGPML